MICHKCGNEISDTVDFCPFCGGKFNTDAQASIKTKNKNEKKKISKSKKAMVSFLVVLIVCVASAAGIGIPYLSSNEYKINQAMNQGDYDEALSVYQDKADGKPSKLLDRVLKKRLSKLKTNFENESVDYSMACKELDTIEKMKLTSVSQDLSNVKDYIIKLNKSRTSFQSAEEMFSKGDYEGAVSKYMQVIETDRNFAAAQERLSESKAKFKEAVLSKSADFAKEGRYIDAVEKLEAALNILPDDERITDRLADYRKSYRTQVTERIKEEFHDNTAFLKIEDYDCNGRYEAFVIKGVPGAVLDSYDSCKIWFVDDSLNSVLLSESNGVIPHEIITAESYSFFKYEVSAGGSGSASYLFGVKNNKPYELVISGKFMDFTNEGNKYTAMTNDFSNGYHDYITHHFVFDKKACEFYIEGYINIGDYLTDDGFTIKGKQLADKLSGMTFIKEIWNCYTDSKATSIEAENNDEIFRMEWGGYNILLYNLSVGSTYAQAKKTLSEKGYRYDESNSRLSTRRFTKGNISIWIYFHYDIQSVNDDTHIVEFQIDLTEN